MGLQGLTWGYMGLQGVSGGSKGLQGVTWDYNRLQKDLFGTRTFQDTFFKKLFCIKIKVDEISKF